MLAVLPDPTSSAEARARANAVRLRLGIDQLREPSRRKWSLPTITNPSVRQVMAEVAEAFGLRYADIIGPRRSKEYVAARHAAIHAVRDAKPHLSLPQIGQHFSRDHTTILYALRKMERVGVPQPTARDTAGGA